MLGKVLILDHNSSWSHFVAKTLSAQGYHPIELKRREQAVALLEEATQQGEEYALIIVDSLVDRTEDNSVKPLEVAQAIAELFPEVPLIVASSRRTPDEAVLAYEAGASAYIPKTCDEGELMELLNRAIRRAKSRGSPETARSRGGKMSEKLLLLVEDDPDQVPIWELPLRQAGYQVIVASSVEQALEAIDNRYFHVAVIDQSLRPEAPGEDILGVDVVLPHLKQQIWRQMIPDVPCIVLTGYPRTEPVEKALDLAAWGYIRKYDPVSDIKLLKKIAEAFETRVRCNFELEINCHGGLSLDKMV